VRRALIWLIGVAAIASAVGLGLRPAVAADSSLGTLGPDHSVITWNGGPFSEPGGLPGASNPLPQVCSANCERHTIDIEFPASTWARPRDGVLIAIKHSDPDDGLNLYVDDPTGQQVGQSNGFDSDGQSVFLAHPANGVYTIIVNATELANSHVTYVGQAWVHHDPCRSGNCLLLPRLQPAFPSDFHIGGLPAAPSTFVGFPFPFTLGPATPHSCWLDETAVQGARRCLRLTNQIDNVGDGPLILRFRLLQPLTNPGVDQHNEYLTGCEMQQVIERDDGTTETRDAGPCVYHVTHGHFHYENMAEFGLYTVNRDGSTGALVRSSEKQGFCLTDVRAEGFGTNRFDGRQYWFPNCNLPSQVDGNAWVRMGVSVGWGDVYTWDVPAQYVEISGVPDGIYDVVSIANPFAQILEVGGQSNGTSRTRICLAGDTVVTVAPTASSCPPRAQENVQATVTAASGQAYLLPNTAPGGAAGPASLIAGVAIALNAATARRRRDRAGRP